MKSIFVISLLVPAFASLANGQAAAGAPMRDAVTHDQLALAYRKSQQFDPMSKMKPVKGPDPSAVNQPKDLVSSSDILCYNGMATLVPKKAILNVPKGMESRMKFLPGSKIQSWADFYALNRGWITTVEVSRVQAEGNKPLDEKVAERIPKSTNLVVATYQGGPISLLPPKAPAESTKEATVQNTNATTKP